MKRKIISVIAALGLTLGMFGCGSSDSQKPTTTTEPEVQEVTPVRISSEVFPDEAFRDYISDHLDKNGDAALDEEEIKIAKTLNMSESGIKNLKGIEWLTELTYLNISNSKEALEYPEGTTEIELNAVKELNLSKNTKLMSLYCDGNELTTLDVSNNPKLTILSCSSNKLTALDVSQNKELADLTCHYNKLTELNLTNNTKLTSLDVDSDTKLTGVARQEIISLHSSEEENRAKELKLILEDDFIIGSFDKSIQATLADETFYSVAQDNVKIRLNHAGTLFLQGLDSHGEAFKQEIQLGAGGNSAIKDLFKSEGYKNIDAVTEFSYSWNNTLYTWTAEIKNNIEGSRFYDSYFDPKQDTIDKPDPDIPLPNPPEGSKIPIKVYAFTKEVPNMFKKYAETHPDFNKKYKFLFTQVTTDNGAYQSALDAALADDDAPDIYMAEAAFVKKYTTGSASWYACTYEDLGIDDVEQKIKYAGIAQYSADITRRDGKVVALGYQGNGCAFIYNRDVAKDVFGDDSPETVQAAIGTSWDSFFEAAEKCKNKGYAIVSGDGDIWHGIENSADKGWVVDGKLYIDPKREQFFDYSMMLKENGYHNDTQDWQEGWFADMAEAGEKKVLGFYGPVWMLNYTLYDHCGDTAGHWGVCRPNVASFWGGTWLIANKNVLDKPELKAAVKEIIEWITLDTSENGLQYQWANAEFDYPEPSDTKDAVASSVVLSKSDGTMSILGGQNAFPVLAACNAYARGDNQTEYDEVINTFFRDAVRAYTYGEFSKEDAIRWFKEQVKYTFEFIKVD